MHLSQFILDSELLANLGYMILPINKNKISQLSIYREYCLFEYSFFVVLEFLVYKSKMYFFFNFILKFLRFGLHAPNSLSCLIGSIGDDVFYCLILGWLVLV